MHRIGITHGLRGYFAVLYDNDGPIQSGIGSYKTAEGAIDEARDWAKSEGIPYDGDICSHTNTHAKFEIRSNS